MYMKRFKKLAILTMMCASFAIPTIGHAQTKTSTPKNIQTQVDYKKMQDLLNQNQVSLDITNGTKAEKVIKDSNGQTVGTLGVEKVSTTQAQPPYAQPNLISPLSTSLPSGVTQTFKVYWYAATVNYSFYMDVYVSPSTGLGKVVSAYDGWYLVIPPGYCSRDTLAITRQYETSSYPAEARYTLNMTAPVSTNLWIYGRVKDHTFYSGGN